MPNTEPENLNQQVRAIWDQKAEFWDAQMGDDGNLFQSQLIGPAAERLLAAQDDMLILEIACGNGVFARRMAQLGARVIAADFSERFIELAKARSTTNSERIEYRVLDATDESALLELGARRFDAAVCNMGLMDMVSIQPLFNALARLLKAGGCFVFAVPHPCFNTTETTMMAEHEEYEGGWDELFSVKVGNYLNIAPARGTGMPGEPISHYYFDRPLHELFGAGFQVGFALDGLEEPALSLDSERRRLLSWTNYPHIPPVLVARMRLLNTT